MLLSDMIASNLMLDFSSIFIPWECATPTMGIVCVVSIALLMLLVVKYPAS